MHGRNLLELIINDDKWGNPDFGMRPYFYFGFMVTLAMSVSMSAFIAMSRRVDHTAGHKNAKCK